MSDGGVTGNHPHLELFCGRNVRLMVMVSSSSLQILLGVSFMICYILLHLFFSSLDCNSISTFTIDADYIHIRYYLFVLFSTPETILIQLCICISWAVCRWVVCSCECSRVRPVPHLLPSHWACSPLHCTLCFHFAGPLLSHQGHDDLLAPEYEIEVVNTS